MKFRFDFDDCLVFIDAESISDSISKFKIRFGELLFSHVTSIRMV